MAFDTVIDRAQLDAAMTSTADAIRSKTGDSAGYAWDLSRGFADVISQIVTGGKAMVEIHEITIVSDLGAGETVNRAILTDNDFVKTNYAKDGFAALLYPVTPIGLLTQYVVHSIFHGNMNIGSTDFPRYGFSYMSSSATSLGYSGMTDKINGNNYNACFRVNSAGNLNLYVGNNRTIKAGTYNIILLCWED